MSFRIEDILKRNSDVKKFSYIPQTSHSPENYCKNEVLPTRNFSILEYTLSNKNNNYQNIHEDHINKASVCYEQFSPGFVDPFFSKVSSRNIYPPTYEQVWSSFLPYPMLFTCSQLNSQRIKGRQVRFTTNQTEVLEKRFSSHKYLGPEDRKQLANLLRLSDRQVKTWFQNRRAKWRKHNQVSSENDVKDTIDTSQSTPEFSNTV